MGKSTLALLILGSLFLAIGVWLLSSAWSSNSWPIVEGQIESTKVVARFSQVSSTTQRKLDYSIEVRYAYEVDGVIHHGQRYSLGTGHTVEGGFSKKSDAREWLKQSNFRINQPINVYVDPNDVKNTVLYAGILWSTWVPIYISLLFIGMGFFNHRYMQSKAYQSTLQ
ncbi:DUF3592 domain-containing protein [Marinicella litoralis]|uniref:Uncharacterized protein DUF3592 n=1 Tax=Marinicella litoralis TaxID=644220 RepID=A0A4R6XC76_9GAMM|nr:DUF3592 domain-containing protein [Marinicella litoralis]TDR16852.1 uncharacterized protein DUF3592 [Marinicella litoralis]